jgi:hypothetical protein
VKAATTVRTGNITAASDSPIAMAPIPICRALTHVGDFVPTVLVALTVNNYKDRLHLKSSSAAYLLLIIVIVNEKFLMLESRYR